MEQTVAQMGTLEQQINAIESANINRETLAAMEKAGDAMRHIHKDLTPQKVDETMCVIPLRGSFILDSDSLGSYFPLRPCSSLTTLFAL